MNYSHEQQEMPSRLYRHKDELKAWTFLLILSEHIKKTITPSIIIGTIDMALHTIQHFAKPKEPFFANIQGNNSYFVPLFNNIS
jgi:hypothetical protein